MEHFADYDVFTSLSLVTNKTGVPLGYLVQTKFSARQKKKKKKSAGLGF